MIPPYEDPAKGWQAPHQGMIQRGQPLHPPLYSGDCLPNWREIPIHCHPTYKAEVQEGHCRDLTCRCGQGRGRHCRTNPSRYHILQSRCEGVASGILQT